MIINFSVSNFRSIKDKIILSFEATSDKNLEEYYVVEPRAGLRILKMAIIYGPNASGKTNVLRALDFLRKIVLEPFASKDKTFNFLPFKFDSVTPKQPTEFELEFFYRKTRYWYKVKLSPVAVLEEELFFSRTKRSLLYARTTDMAKQLTSIKFGSKVKVSKSTVEILQGNTLWNNTVLGGFMKTNIQIPEIKDVVDWFREKLLQPVSGLLPLELITSNLLEENIVSKENLIKLLRQADFAIENIEIKKEEIEDETLLGMLKKMEHARAAGVEKQDNSFFFLKKIFQHKIKSGIYNLEFEEESNGTQRFFGLAGLLLKTLKDGNILPIDELEASLHPDLIRHFLLTFLVNSKNSQLIATTHHRELLLEREILRRDVVWFTERKPNDQSTEMFSLSNFDTSVIRKQSSIYNFYKAGRFGAVPNLKSYYLKLGHEEQTEKIPVFPQA
jgi:AAA15 family ATPase/GTPase